MLKKTVHKPFLQLVELPKCHESPLFYIFFLLQILTGRKKPAIQLSYYCYLKIVHWPHIMRISGVKISLNFDKFKPQRHT